MKSIKEAVTEMMSTEGGLLALRDIERSIEIFSLDKSDWNLYNLFQSAKRASEAVKFFMVKGDISHPYIDEDRKSSDVLIDSAFNYITKGGSDYLETFVVEVAFNIHDIMVRNNIEICVVNMDQYIDSIAGLDLPLDRFERVIELLNIIKSELKVA